MQFTTLGCLVIKSKCGDCGGEFFELDCNNLLDYCPHCGVAIDVDTLGFSGTFVAQVEVDAKTGEARVGALIPQG